MRYSFMTFSAPTLSWGELTDWAGRLGYDGVEIRLGSGHGHQIEPGMSRDQVCAVKRRAEDSGIAIAALAGGARLAGADTIKEREDALRCLDLANELGVKVLRVFGGSFEGERAAAADRLREGLQQLAAHTGADGCTPCLETHDAWCRPEDVADVLAACGPVNVGVNWDLMHPVRFPEAPCTMRHAFDVLAPYIRHVHVHDGRMRGSDIEFLPIGQGIVDHKTAIECLAGANYAGFLSGEWINWNDPEHLARELKTMRALEAE